MKVNMLFFGISSDLIGKNSMSVEVSENISVVDFKSLLQESYPKLSEINSYAIAVNESYATDEEIIKESDVVAIIPPVSGG